MTPARLLAAAGAAATAAAAVPPVGETLPRVPPMGWNSWNLFGCSVNAQILQAAADGMAANLMSAGYNRINSDDCWALPTRDPTTGKLVPDPTRFPNGMPATADYVHGKGLLFGIYTARGSHTCAGKAASCGHEALDAATFASWGVDYIKDDDCGGCTDYLSDYGHMQQGVWATGRNIYLSVEGGYDPAVAMYGGYGQQKRVGHDIEASFKSMVSLVDIGAGLWPYAHNGSAFTNTTSQPPLPFWNDLDMIEVGNGEFDCSTPMGMVGCRTHFSMWTIMKSPLLLGNDLATMPQTVIDVVTNAEAIAVNQDALGVQARRLAVAMPANNTLGATAWDGNTVIRKCDPATYPTQLWKWRNMTSGGTPNLLYLVDCKANDPLQQWAFAGAGGTAGTLQNKGAPGGLCVDAEAQFDPAKLVPCNAGAASQQWVLQAASGHIAAPAVSNNHCLDVYNFVGPDVEVGTCKTPGDQDSNQVWTWVPSTGQIMSNSTGINGNARCLAASAGPSGGQLVSTDPATGREWCLTFAGGEGAWGPAACIAGGDKTQLWQPVLQGGGGVPPAGPANYTLGNGGGGMYYNNQAGASGPWPHSRYVAGYSWSGSTSWTLDLAAAASPNGPGSTIQAADSLHILDDDLVGGVTVGGAFCLDFTTNGMLETWGGPLTGGRYAVALFNRSPAADKLTVTWAQLGANPGASYKVRDIWAASDMGTFTGSYTAMVDAHAVAYLVLTPA